MGVLLWLLPLAAQKEPPLPRISSASMPFYPATALEAGIEGTVLLRVTTDGRRIVVIQPENGPELLAQPAIENVKTWRFDSHAPTSFEVKFQYRFAGYSCDPECNCHALAPESVRLRLPAEVELVGPSRILCNSTEPAPSRTQ